MLFTCFWRTVFVTEIHGMRKALHSHQTVEKRRNRIPWIWAQRPLTQLHFENSSMLNSTNATLQWHFHCVLSFLAVYPRNAQKTWHWRDICWMLLVNVTFTSERFLAPQRYFSIANLVCIYSRHSKKCLEFLAISLSQSHLCSQQLSKKSLHISWSPIEAAEELEVAKSVEMSEEAVRKSIFVESLEHCVVPTSDVDHALVGEDLDFELLCSFQ